MIAFIFSQLPLLLAAFPLFFVTIAEKAPFLCQRSGHQSTIKNNAIYVFGGSQIFPGASTKSNSSALPDATFGNGTFRIDLTRPWNLLEDSSQYRFLDISNRSRTPANTLVGGGLFQSRPDSSNISLYGGAPIAAHDENNTSIDPITVANEIWTFDTTLSSWRSQHLTPNLLPISRHSAHAESPDRSLAFYLDTGGMSLINTSSKETLQVASSPANLSRIGSQLQFIPDLGTKGVLVLLGGASVPRNGTYDRASNELVPMSTIHVLDVDTISSENATWFEQGTSGRTPGPRMDFCITMAIAPDKSSYNIYVYGGRSQSEGYADVWVLSLPQFHWTKVIQGVNERFGHTCHLLGSKQMIILGGKQNKGSSKLGYCAPLGGYIELLDMTSLQWATEYVKPDPPYQVPRAIVEWIGGNVYGNASMSRPEDDFSSEGLAGLFGKSLASVGGSTTDQASGTVQMRVRHLWVTICFSVGVLLAMKVY